jgi:formylglycine-generating enzyme required for sulfatase activity
LKPSEIDKDRDYLRSDTIFDVANFQIAKYPITTAQYYQFIDAGGYENKEWWTDEGWYAKQKGWVLEPKNKSWYVTDDPWIEPFWWNKDNWNLADQPIIGVSWHEAIAYCYWLTSITDEIISLPTEQQWQRAAQGDDNRIYPWGNDWDADYCNNNVQGENNTNTSSVRQYEGNGDSPFGVVDMSGNVWEWCSTAFDTGTTITDTSKLRILRGGSHANMNIGSFCCEFRHRLAPYYRNPNLGFRIVRLK